VDVRNPIEYVMEEFDNGGNGDYTKEKYEQPDYTIQEILSMKKKCD
jgi:hypothetical protein